MCVCVRERERERGSDQANVGEGGERERNSACMYVHVHAPIYKSYVYQCIFITVDFRAADQWTDNLQLNCFTETLDVSFSVP